MDLFWNKYGKNRLVYQLYCFAVTALVTAAAAVLSILLHRLGLEKENLLMIFLVGVLLTTVLTRGYVYGFLCSAASIFLFDYYFTSPVFTFIISNTQDLILLMFFLIAALISGMLSRRLQRQSEIAQENARVTRLVSEITESFLNLSGVEAIAENGLERIREHTGLACSLTLAKKAPDCEQTVFSAGTCPSDAPSSDYPVPGKTQALGTLHVCGAQPLSAEADTIVRSAATQMGLALEREYMDAEREHIQMEMETERMKATLLRSVSHDIRTPLTGIMGASSTILSDYDSLSSADVRRLAQDINDSSAWLVMTVQNILDMTRIQGGKLDIHMECEAVDDLVNQLIQHVPYIVNSGRLTVKMPDDILLVNVDGRMFDQALLNILDNAYKHSGENTHICLSVFRDGANVVFEVADDGCGIDPAVTDTLFNEFVTFPANRADRGRGVGLGLAICRAIVTAHGGTITAKNNETGGATFRVEIPLEEGIV
jgi:two-component system sensor histidine kinase KdpD